MTPLVPSWAPNVHPLLVHFPIVLLITAAAADAVHTGFDRPRVLAGAATALYAAGAVSAFVAYYTGTQAAATVYLPGMAYPIVESHRSWAFATALYATLLGLVRLWVTIGRISLPRLLRVVLLTTGLILVVFVQQTAERGARLVFQQGVGVIAAPPSP